MARRMRAVALGFIGLLLVGTNVLEEDSRMIDLEQYLYDRVLPVMRTWDAEDIYAVSFFVYSNEAHQYRGTTNVSEFTICYNTEGDCQRAAQFSEERWNYAYWAQNTEEIIAPYTDGDEGIKVLFDWYAQEGITGIGDEDSDSEYDACGNYIGKGPVGYYELLCAVSNVARRIQREGLLPAQFGDSIPIIVHDLEYPWYVEEATANANPQGEAEVFLEAMRMGFSA